MASTQWDHGLEGAGLVVAGSNADVLRVAAGPGTGKSFTMKRRLVRMINEMGIDPKRILAVTFTRTAAKDLVDSISELDVEAPEDISAGTLHSFCFRMLGREAVFDIVGRVPRGLLAVKKSGVLRFEFNPLLADLNDGDYGAAREKTKRMWAFEAAWARLQSDEPGWPTDEVDSKFHDELIDWLTFHQAILVGELIPLSLDYLRENPAADEHKSFDLVVVDEYQDLNKAEQVLIDTLAKDSQLMVIGDEDQSIYEFRSAHPDGINEFLDTHEGAEDAPLEECRRCPLSVVELADHLIKRNHPGSQEARLRPFEDNPDGTVSIIQWSEVAEEIQGLAAYIRHLVEDHGEDPGDILVLTPRKLIGYAIREVLEEGDIPVHSFYNEEPIEEDEAQRALTLLRLLAEPRDRVALRWWLGQGSPSWNRRDYGKLRKLIEEQGGEPYDTLADHSEEELKSSFKQLAANFLELVDLREEHLESSVEDVVEAILPDEDWADALRETALELLEETPDQQLIDLVDALTYQISQPDMPEEGEFVRIMSFHKSKGLTAKIVILAGCVKGLVPTIDSKESVAEQRRQLAEGRRLFYVACTRCTDTLVVSSFRLVKDEDAYRLGVAQGKRRGRAIATRASQFIQELGPSAPRPVVGQEWLNSMGIDLDDE